VIFMGNAADTLVSQNPTRIAQLNGPVLVYLKREAKRLPYTGGDQDFYLSVFYPAYRRKPINTTFPADVLEWNPGIRTPGDYVALINKQKLTVQLTPAEWTALKDTASALGVGWEALYKLINFESAWNPLARNKSSGARGLIQFIPSTAAGMGYKAGTGIGPLLLIAGIGFFAWRKYGKLRR
jgi:soluble lytic murein transglycosylase-like protein